MNVPMALAIAALLFLVCVGLVLHPMTKVNSMEFKDFMEIALYTMLSVYIGTVFFNLLENFLTSIIQTSMVAS